FRETSLSWGIVGPHGAVPVSVGPDPTLRIFTSKWVAAPVGPRRRDDCAAVSLRNFCQNSELKKKNIFLSFCILSSRIQSYPLVSSRIPSYPIVSSHILSYPLVSSRIPSYYLII